MIVDVLAQRGTSSAQGPDLGHRCDGRHGADPGRRGGARGPGDLGRAERGRQRTLLRSGRGRREGRRSSLRHDPRQQPHHCPRADRRRAFQSTPAGLAARRVDVPTTELDIAQASPTAYADTVRACPKVPRCTGVPAWRIRDSDSWRSGDSPPLCNGSGNQESVDDAVLSALGGATGARGHRHGSGVRADRCRRGARAGRGGGRTANGTPLRVRDSHSGVHPQRRASRNGDSSYTPTNSASGRVPDEAGGQTANGTWRETCDADSGADQHRRANRNGDGTCTPATIASRRALEAPARRSAHGALVQIRDSDDGADRHCNVM
ncbi:RICIN domain-containing protein [Streptomyces sp. SCL15-4]|uniref:RICIN domain-containing protein n=1 Tax=Streptomyces sp. SCL15-4 TaxID=2967221 RepID=UPI002967061E|nr:endo-1,4-beta-xylanase [Streptomyces sp. SCL15-4]